MIAPLRISFEVECLPAQAFMVWTTRIDTWWPRDHTVTGNAALVVLESGVGGRIFERALDGKEHEWGVVTRWDPPRELGYRWHLGAEPATATEVSIRFAQDGDTRTHVEIEHRGWERLGGAAVDWRARNQAGWDTLLPYFEAAAARGEQ